ncbi:MraZ protein [Neisseria sp. HSC-16F19]|nr:MraZ protein [Neisseria sp. HSC-16F19]
MFGGAYELSIDSKGRLAIPAKFRDLLLRHYSPFLVATLEKRSHLWLYPESEWDKVAAQLLNLKTAGNPKLQSYQNLLLHNADTLELDSAGRVLLPANLRQLVNFDKEVMVVGRRNRLEIWNRAVWRQSIDDALDMDETELAAELSQTELLL